jgi:hypothetical protein
VPSSRIPIPTATPIPIPIPKALNEWQGVTKIDTTKSC